MQQKMLEFLYLFSQRILCSAGQPGKPAAHAAERCDQHASRWGGHESGQGQLRPPIAGACPVLLDLLLFTPSCPLQLPLPGVTAQHAVDADGDSGHAWQAESMEDVDRRLDGLAQSGRLDPAFMLTMSNAYANTKLTDATKEEVKDIMYYMYQQVRCYAKTMGEMTNCCCLREHTCSL